MKINQGYFYTGIIAIFLGAISPQMFSDGMFLDGTIYAVLSRNLASGIGSFWDLHFTSTLDSHFIGHPPLAIGLQSLVFQLVGDTIYVERFYSLLTIFLTGWIITLIWQTITDQSLKVYGWLPLLFWITIPLLMWTARNNLLENTVMVFTTASVLFILKGSFEGRRYFFLVISGIMIFCGLMTKGLVALFPLSLLFWIFLITRKIGFKRFLTDTLIMVSAIIGAFLVIFFLAPESMNSLQQYFNQQVVDSLTNYESDGSRFSIVERLISELIPLLALTLVLVGITWKIAKPIIGNWHYVMLALGLSGTLPIMVSLKQGGFYIVPALPFFAIAAAYWVVPRVDHLISKIDPKSTGFRIFQVIIALLLIISIGLNGYFSQVIGRDKATVQDVRKVVEQVPKQTTIAVKPSLWKNWDLHAYCHRYGFISLKSASPFEESYALVKKGQAENELESYEKVQLSLNQYTLYKKMGNRRND